MVVPIGIDPLKGIVAAYNTVTGNLATINIEKITPNDIDKIDSQFQVIKDHFCVLSFNACVCVNEKYGNDIRVAFVENAKKHDFTNFCILDFTSALYIHAVFKSAFKSKNGDKIWIFWQEYCYVYEHIDDNIVFREANPHLVNTKNESLVAIFQQINLANNISNDSFPNAKLYYFFAFSPETAALIKAQFMMDSNNKMSSLKIKSCCGRKIEVFVNDRNLLAITAEQSVPYENIINVVGESQNYKLKITENDVDVKELSLNAKSFVFTIDSNGIYSIKTLDSQTIIQDKTLESIAVDPVDNAAINESPSIIESGIYEKEPALPPPNIKRASPNYIIPEKFEHYVEMIHQLGYIQTELNILNPLVAIINTEIDLKNFKHLQACHESYKPAIAYLETLLERVKVQVQDENNKFGINHLKNITESAVNNHAILKQNYDKTNVLLQKAEIYLTKYNQEMEWINSKLSSDELTFDTFDNSLDSLNLYKILKQEVKDHEQNYQIVIKDGKEFIKQSNQGVIEEFIGELKDKWQQLKDYIEFHSAIITKVKKAVECCKKADAIEEWLSAKNKVISRNDSNTGLEIITEMQMKKTKKLLGELELYYENVELFEKEANSIKSEIILSGSATKTKLSIFLDVLEKRVENIKISFNNLRENVNDQIQKLDEEKLAFEFNKQCNAVEHQINKIMESLNVEITKDNAKVIKTNIIAAEDLFMNIMETTGIKENAEKLIAGGFPEAKLKITKIENLLEKHNQVLYEKHVQIEDFLEIQKIIFVCDKTIEDINIQMEAITLITGSEILEEYETSIKRFTDKNHQLIEECGTYKSKYAKYANEMNEKMKELEEANNRLIPLLEAKSKAIQTAEVTEFNDNANELLNLFEHIMSEIEHSNTVDAFANINLLMENHDKLKQQMSSTEYKITLTEKHGNQLLQKDPSKNDIQEMLGKITHTKHALNLAWKKRYDEYQDIKDLAAFNAKAEETIELLKEYYKCLKNNENEEIDNTTISNKLEEVNLHIDGLQEIAHKVIEMREDLAEAVNAKVNEILDIHSDLINPIFNDSTKVKNEGPKAETTITPRCRLSSVPIDPTPTKYIETQNYLIPKKLTNYDEKINAVGIDLGTSRCCMAVSRNNKMETVALENTGERPLPSFVSFDEEHDKCGDIVIQGLQRGQEKYTCFDIKRIIGKHYHDIIPDKSWPFTVLEEDGHVMIKTQTKNGEVMKKPEEISAVLLKYMKEKVSTFQGKELTEAVLTVPAAFSELQKEATLKAAKIAGWQKIHLLPEPVAASFAYFNNRDISDNSNVLLFDLGGGTLDVCLFKIINGSLQIIANNGDTCLGGRDIDNLLIRHFATVLKYKYNIDIKNKLKRRYQLMIECQKIKHNLTIREHDILDAETFDTNVEGNVKIERHELEELVMDLIQRMRSAVNQTLYSAKLNHKEINKVLQVGGGCRMPIIKEMLQKMFPQAEQCCEEQPDEVVAVGAAIYAYHLATQSAS